MKEEWIELIDRSIKEQTTATEEEHIRNLCNQNDAFRKQYDMMIHLEKVVAVESRNEQKAYLEELREGLQAKRSRKKRWLWVAVIVLLATLLLSLWIMGSSSDSQASISNEAYAQLFTLPQNEVFPSTRSTDQKMSVLQQAFVAYDDKNYADALELFQQESSNSPTIQYYKALSAVGASEWKQAEQGLLTLIGNEQVNQPNLQWYLSYVYTQTAQMDKAEQLWQQMAQEEGHPYAEKAKQALRFHERG